MCSKVWLYSFLTSQQSEFCIVAFFVIQLSCGMSVGVGVQFVSERTDGSETFPPEYRYLLWNMLMLRP